MENGGKWKMIFFTIQWLEHDGNAGKIIFLYGKIEMIDKNVFFDKSFKISLQFIIIF